MILLKHKKIILLFSILMIENNNYFLVFHKYHLNSHPKTQINLTYALTIPKIGTANYFFNEGVYRHAIIIALMHNEYTEHFLIIWKGKTD